VQNVVQEKNIFFKLKFTKFLWI